jgi:hypothetical protein
MKLLISAVLILSATSVFADVNLPVGGSAIVGGETVTCGVQTSTRPRSSCVCDFIRKLGGTLTPKSYICLYPTAQSDNSMECFDVPSNGSAYAMRACQARLEEVCVSN